MIGRRRQGWALYAAMLVMFLGGTIVLYVGRASRRRRSMPRACTTW